MSSNSEQIECKICGSSEDHIEKHLASAHPGWGSFEDYQVAYPGAPVISPRLAKAIQVKAGERKQAQAAQHAAMAKIIPINKPGATIRKPMFEVFELPLTNELRSAPKRGQTSGDPIMIEVMDTAAIAAEHLEAIPEIDDGYVFPIEETKDAAMAVQLNMPLLIWGLHGTGKTTLIEQILARMNRPWFRVQHTGTTEEAHIIGQMVVRNGATEFDYGPLALAMIHGYAYVADEYDFAQPSVIAVYQPVLEGKPLYIKEAPPSMRLIKPHPNFRFIATGNTNGSGDDTGLYAGTNIGNAASYSRFGVTIQVHYPPAKTETAMLITRLSLTPDIADKLVDFANRIREMYRSGEISLPISPRELIRAATIGMVKGGMFRKGIELAYSNRLDPTQGESVSQTAQRIFG